MIYQRPHLQLLKSRMKEDRKFIQVVYGPRQVGKTTLINQLLNEIDIPNHYVAADAVANSDHIWISQQWETARLKFNRSGSHQFIFAIDEVQKIENWSEVIKKLWDEDTMAKRNIKIILSGSSRLLLQQGLTESLAGRFETIFTGHWLYSEMNQAFGWDASMYAWYGGYPGPANMVSDEPRWKNYVLNSLIEASISKDILMLTRVDKPVLMKRLFELGCSYSGQILSFNKMLGQLIDAGNTTTLSHYLHLLDSACLLCGLEKFSYKVIRQRSSSPKFQVHNSALLNAQRQENFTQITSQPEKWGRIVESAVGAHLLNYSITDDFSLSYWREGNYEVDFVLRKGNKILAVEVKSGKRKPVQGTEMFLKKYPGAKVLVVENQGFTWQELLNTHPGELL